MPAADKNFDYYWTVDGSVPLDRVARSSAASRSVRATTPPSVIPREIYIDYDAELIGDELDLRLTYR